MSNTSEILDLMTGVAGAPLPAVRRRRDPRQALRLRHDDGRDTLQRVLAHVMPRRRATAATQAILAEFGDMAAALGADHAALEALPEVRRAGADLVKAIHSAALHLAEDRQRSSPTLNSIEAVLAYVAGSVLPGMGEGLGLRALCLDAANRLIADEAIATAGGDGAMAGAAGEILRRALQMQARSVILVHADPEGGAMPSDRTINATHDIQHLAENIGVMLLDHVVVGRDGPVSMRRMGLLRGLCRIG